MFRSRSNIFLILSCFVSVYSCIEEYVPAIEAGESKKYVVFGQLTTGSEDQDISVALASSLEDPEPVPLNDCRVSIVDIHGNAYTGNEFEDGRYRVRIPSERLVPGEKYRLEVTTAAEVRLVSEYEELLECPEIDSVYYVRETLSTSDPGVFTEGIRFYLDLDAGDYENAYYKFDVEETWEYHTEYPLEWYYDGSELHHVEPRDFSNHVCWKTMQVRDIFILSTLELKNNSYRKLPLHFVDNTTQRLLYRYSVLVKQYALSDRAYFFWDQLRMNNTEQENLYETQPLQVQGNMVNLTRPGQSVLGYFMVSTVKTKRIFVKDVPGLDIHYQPECGVFRLRNGLKELTPNIYTYPVYLFIDRGTIYELTPECIFCQMSGGTTTRPDYWPENR